MSSEGSLLLTRAAVAALAAGRGLELRTPEPNELYLDIDSAIAAERCSRLRDETERVMLQALLGSDPMRELLAWRRLQLGAESDSISCFFERLG